MAWKVEAAGAADGTPGVSKDVEIDIVSMQV